jgi:hypothetical protein
VTASFTSRRPQVESERDQVGDKSDSRASDGPLDIRVAPLRGQRRVLLTHEDLARSAFKKN